LESKYSPPNPQEIQTFDATSAPAPRRDDGDVIMEDAPPQPPPPPPEGELKQEPKERDLIFSTLRGQGLIM